MSSTKRSSRALKAGTRSSPLSLIQTETALARLSKAFGLRFESVALSSPGDRDKKSDLRGEAADFFTKDLDDALLEGRIDLAVHSAKDLPDPLPKDLDFLWLPWREDPRDVLAMPKGKALPEPAAKIRIGVSSERRERYCRARFPEAEILPLRGNIEERLAQLDEGRFDMIVLAAAGLQRLGLAARISETIPLSELETPAGQGFLALTFREGDWTFRTLRQAFVKTAVFAGAGPGPKELMTLVAADELSRCDVCLHDSLLNRECLSLLRPGAEAIYVGKRNGEHSVSQERICELLTSFVRQGKKVLRLKGGDPGLFGRLAEETDALAKLDLPFRVAPGVSSLSAATSATGLLLTKRGVSRGFRAESCRKSGSASFEPLTKEEREKLPLVVFMGASETRALCEQALKEGLAPSTPAALVLGAASDEEKILCGTLESLPGLAEKETSELPGLIVIGSAADGGNLFAKRGALAAKKVLLVCSEILAEKAAHAVRDFGGTPVRLPMTELKPRDAELDFKGVDWLLCASPSAAEILLAKCDPRRLPKIISCGPGTSAELLKRGIRPEIEAKPPYGSEALLKEAGRLLKKGETVLRIRSSAAGSFLGDNLKKLGLETRDLVLYDTIPLKREKLPAFDMAFFSSVSELEAFAESFGTEPLERRKVVAIGGPTLRWLLEACPEARTLLAEEATAEEAAQTLARSETADILKGSNS